jgi:cytochrome P450
MRDYHTDFDHMDDDFAGRLYEITDDLRRTCPVAHGSAHGGFVAISRYADVYAVAHDYATYSSAEGITLPPFGNPTPSVPLECDPPETRVYRNLLMPYLSPAAVQELEPAILGRIDGLLDAMESNGGGDLAEEFVVPLPAQVTCDLMGLPAEDGPQLVEWENACFKHQDPAAIAGLLEYLGGHLVDRRTSPRDDLMTAIATFEVDGVPMPDDKAVAMSLLVAGAGFDTTAGGLGHLLRIIAADDSLRQGLIDKTLDISLMVEESLRFETPLQGVARKVRQPATLGDETVQPGDWVALLLGSANRDAEKFPNPEVFDPARKPNRHVAFGTGVHTCLGMHLARTEMRMGVERLLERFPDFQTTAEPEVVHRGFIRAVEHMPVSFVPSRVPS